MNHNDEEYNWKEERAALLILIEELNKAIEITRVENDALERAFEEEKAKWAALEKENAECVVHINQNSIIQVKLTQEDIENNNVDQVIIVFCLNLNKIRENIFLVVVEILSKKRSLLD